jgi:hypothetical protein
MIFISLSLLVYPYKQQMLKSRMLHQKQDLLSPLTITQLQDDEEILFGDLLSSDTHSHKSQKDQGEEGIR